MRIQHSVFALCAAILVLAFSVSAPAQFSQRGSIGGVVTEASGAVLPKASVTSPRLRPKPNFDHHHGRKWAL